VRKLGELEYREEVLKILREFRNSGVMTFTEVTDRIMAIPIQKEKKNPYEGMSTREDVDFGKGKKIDNSQKKLF
jgi:hypothetical protein